MKQLEFESSHNKFWDDIESFLEKLNSNKKADKLESYNQQLSSFPSDYRRLCQHLAVSKSRRYSSGLVSRLNGLVQRSYESLYSRSLSERGGLIGFFVYGFPASLRSNGPFLWVACAVFVLPLVLIMIGVLINDQLIYSVMDPANVRMMESMYDPGIEKFGRERQSDSDIMMFGHYIYNNIGIAFRCFAMGLFAGVGSLFVLAFNGLHIGAVMGHLTSVGFTETFYPFVVGHGSFELTAIVFSGAAGLKLGFALIAPGKFTRLHALKIAAKDAIKIMYGVFVMLLIAAFIEAFWSSSSNMPAAVKYSVGGVLWVLVLYYCFFFARGRVATYQSQNAA